MHRTLCTLDFGALLIFLGLIIRLNDGQAANLKNSSTNSDSGPEYLCPDNEEIGQCSCYYDAHRRVSVSCEGPQITQESLSVLFTVLRATLQLSPHDSQTPILCTLNIISTPLTSIDLSPFLGTKFTRLCFYDNEYLSLIYLSPQPRFQPQSPSTLYNDTQSGGKILAEKLVIEGSPLGDKGIAQALQNFEPTLLSELHIRQCEITGNLYQIPENYGSERDFFVEYEFLPGLADLTQLKELGLDSNSIDRIKHGQFKRNLESLDILDLSNNRLTGLGEDAFLAEFEPSSEYLLRNQDEDLKSKSGKNEISKLYINLADNLLYSSDFMRKDSGLIALSRMRSVELNLENNQMEILNESNFLPFLLINPNNTLRLGGNPLKCQDDRMRWLKNKDIVNLAQRQVFGAKC